MARGPDEDTRLRRAAVPRLVLAIVVLPAAAALAAEPPEPAALRYDLRPGDRLTYRETLRRESRADRAGSAVALAWVSELLVLGQGREGAAVGIQRRRVSAELVSARENGRDTLARERPGFAAEAARARPETIAEANVFDPRGQALLDLQAQREWPSELLPLVHEIVPLPAEAVAPGATWRGGAPLGLDFRAEAWEDVAGDPCLRLRGALPGDQVVLRAWFSPSLGALRRLEMDGRYPGVGRELHEELRFELLERARGESVAQWLQAPERRRGALAALLKVDGVAVEPRPLEALLRAGEEAVQLDALAVAWRRRMELASEAVAPLQQSPDPRVRVLAGRLLGGTKAAPALAALSAQVWSGGLREDWRCEEAGAWADQALVARRAPAEPPGVRLALGQEGAARGRPYVLRVPEDYRGDEPVPLLVYLSGGPGRALAGWSSAWRALAPTGYLAVFPQAAGMWWDQGSEEAVAALLDELLRRYDVDVNRVYLAGFSNGGTGALRYAALWPDRFAAAVSLMGAGLFVDGASPAPAGGLGALPLLFVHGQRDPVIPARASEETVAELRRQVPGARVELRLLPGREHELVLDDDGGLTLPFLEPRRREPFPREVTVALSDLRSPRRFWIEALELAKGGGEARVEGRIRPDGAVELRTRRVRRLRLLLRRELLPEGELRVVVDGREAWRGTPRHDCALLQRTWRETGDPFRAWSFELPLEAVR